ncbi:SRPBCC family protein [Streptomyces sp. SPB074]|uniref:SRPBCC family protein n=1 Tax=Streptomyces sp. (strain SPB074) TaxID=465543 RepID=UPI00017F11F3|nr:SRPBCC family protein [Streptomyces sp. SPB074]EDY42535.1 granaticin polyketide synthase bifunctional cyclase/dehydratase [Streptomyces sp. SPB074]
MSHAPHTTEHTITVAAAPETVFALVERAGDWPHVFPPTLHVEYLERADDEERLRIWATANGEVKSWTSRRVLDRAGLRIRFRQEVSQDPVAAMGGEWIVEPLPDGGSRVRLLHDFRAVDDLEHHVAWIRKAIEQNSAAELAALASAARRAGTEEEPYTFEDSVRVDAPAEEVRTFLREAGQWQERLPHVARVLLEEDTPGVQHLRMDTRGPDGSTHTTASIRICLPDGRITYKQSQTPALMSVHTGEWTVRETPWGSVAVSRHTVVVNPGAVTKVLGASATVADAHAFIRDALGGNSTITMRHAKEFAERQGRTEPVGPAEYASIQQFYARQTRLLDEGDGAGWAGTFTDDGVFDQSAFTEPVRGRASIASAVRKRPAPPPGTVRRHWLGLPAAWRFPDGSVRTGYDALVVSTPAGAAPVLRLSTTCGDVLVADGDSWLVRHRYVGHDGQ